MEDNIISYLKDAKKAQTIIEINDYLNLKSSEDLEKLQNELNRLVSAGIIHETKKNKYMLMEDCPSLYTGKIDITKNGYAFLIRDEADDIFISKDNINGAIEGDTVLVDTYTRNGSLEGKVLKILNRSLNRVVGEIKYVNNVPEIILDDKKLNIDIKIENHFADLVDGHKVLVELVKQIGERKFIGVVLKIIGHKNDPDIDILSIAYKHGIELEFPKEVMEEVKKIPEVVREKDTKIGRVDLTKEMIFTIDGDDTKDIDDAVSIKKNADYYELGVHIADVTYYVRPNSFLHKEAYNRGTSSYLADKVLPMLPHELSNGICSLNPGVERLTISCVMKIDKKGNIFDYDIFPSIIKSRKQMTYNCVNKILIDGVIPEGYEQYKDAILEMEELSQILRKKKINNGYIEFNIPEVKIVQDENGKCIDIKRKEQKAGENLIEDFMIAANTTVATHIYNMDLPFIYRVHGSPKEEKIEDFLNLLKILNININTRGIDTSSKSMQRILNSLKDLNEASILSNMLLKSMQKAIYSVNNIGHFGLGLKNYTHFTSPIRRFPDTTVHELLRTYLFKKEIDNETIDYYSNYLEDVALHSSIKEQDSVDAEREVVDMKMAEYMESHIGEEYEGIITTVTSFGFFVSLPNLVEGLVHISTLNGYYNYVPEMLSLIGENKKMYRIGDKVKIKVVNASKESGMIDFEVLDGNNK